MSQHTCLPCTASFCTTYFCTVLFWTVCIALPPFALPPIELPALHCLILHCLLCIALPYAHLPPFNTNNTAFFCTASFDPVCFALLCFALPRLHWFTLLALPRLHCLLLHGTSPSFAHFHIIVLHCTRPVICLICIAWVCTVSFALHFILHCVFCTALPLHNYYLFAALHIHCIYTALSFALFFAHTVTCLLICTALLWQVNLI